MEGLKLNEECCFSCLQPFDAARSEINISENSDALRRILDINFLVDKPNESMNLCIPCYSMFKAAKEEYLQLVELEKRFNSKRRKFAFTVVKSVEDDDYLGTSIEDHILNARAKIYNKWQKMYKDDVAANKDCSTVVANNGVIVGEIGEPVVPQSKISVKPVKINPVAVPQQSSSISNVKRVVVVSGQNGQGAGKESAPIPRTHLQGGSSPGNVPAGVAQRRVIFIKRDPVTGAVTHVKPANPEVAKTLRYRINKEGTNFCSSTGVRIVTPPKGTQNVIRIQKDGTVVQHSSPVVQQPQARPIVRTPIPTPNKFAILPKAQPATPIIVAKKSLPVAPSPIKQSSSESSTRKDDSELPNGPDKKKRRESVQEPTIPSATQLSIRSRRVIRKPVDSSCLYGNEYERAVKNSSKKTQMKSKAVKRSSGSPADVDEDSYRYDEDAMQDEGEGNFDQFEEDDDDIAAEAQGETSGIEC